MNTAFLSRDNLKTLFVNWWWLPIIVGVVLMVGALFIQVIFHTDYYHWSGAVTGKEVVGVSDFMIIAKDVQGKRVFEAWNSTIYASIDVGNVCDFTLQNASRTVFIMEAKCSEGNHQ